MLLPALGGSAAQQVLGRKLVLRVHAHVLHVVKEAGLVGEDAVADGAGPHA